MRCTFAGRPSNGSRKILTELRMSVTMSLRVNSMVFGCMEPTVGLGIVGTGGTGGSGWATNHNGKPQKHTATTHHKSKPQLKPQLQAIHKYSKPQQQIAIANHNSKLPVTCNIKSQQQTTTSNHNSKPHRQTTTTNHNSKPNKPSKRQYHSTHHKDKCRTTRIKFLNFFKTKK